MKSQIAQMSGVIPATNKPNGMLSRLVQGEIKGGDAKVSFILSIVSQAVREAYKGNDRDIKAALTLCTGKAKKARAFHAGLVALGDIARVVYSGKLDAADNAAARKEINDSTDAATERFKGAFATVMAEKAAPKAAKVETVAPAAAATEGTDSDVPSVDTITVESVDVGAAVDAVAAAIQAGLLERDEITMIRAALALYDAMQTAPAKVAELQA